MRLSLLTASVVAYAIAAVAWISHAIVLAPASTSILRG